MLGPLTDDFDLWATKLALLFHDPPWKYWTVTKQLQGFSKTLEKKLLGEQKEQKDDSLLSKIEDCRAGKSAHDWEALLLLALLAKKLEGKRAGRLARQALEKRCRGDSRVRRADVVASSFDRIIVYYAEEALLGPRRERGEGLEALERRFRNPFDPSLSYELDRVDATSLKNFVEDFVESVASLVEHRCQEKERKGEGAEKDKRGEDECEKLLLHVAFLLLEHMWHKHFKSASLAPADSRVPHHTVFDHLSASMAMANVVKGGEGFKGYLVVVDLASVQSWIGEARRLRDLWAASWIASWLAWKTVEPFVDRFGPDVLLQPPTRLNPFYAAWLLSKLGYQSWEDLKDDAKNHQGARALLDALEPWFKGWPVDPTLPSRLVLVLPRYTGMKGLEEEIKENYRRAWGLLVEKMAEYVESLVRVLEKKRDVLEKEAKKEDERGVAKALLALLDYYAKNNGLEELRELEPPLPLRLIIIDLGMAYNEFKDWLRKKRPIHKEGSQDTARDGDGGKKEEKDFWDVAKELLKEKKSEAGEKTVEAAQKIIDAMRGAGGEPLFYSYLMHVAIPCREEEAKIKASRRSGQGYLDYAVSMRNAMIGRGSQPRLCSVCGKAVALVEGPAPGTGLAKTLLSAARSMHEEKAVELLGEIAGERLCPYCLVKRLLRRIIGEQGERLVGIELAKEHKRMLRSGSVDSYTSRIALNADRIHKVLREYIEDLGREELSEADELVAWRLVGLLPSVPDYWIDRYLGQEKKEELVELLKALPGKAKEHANRLADSLENAAAMILVDDAYARLVVENMGSLGARLVEKLREEAGSGAAYYAIVAADGDYMGKGILGGRLGVEPEQYAEKVFNIKRYRREVALAFSALVRAFDMLMERCGEPGKLCEKKEEKRCKRERLSTLVSPSYHSTVSRALAATSVEDRRLVESLGGFLVYAGGDDLLAIAAPASKPYSQGKEGWDAYYPALMLAIRSRRVYWAEDSAQPGFHVAPGVVVPAIRGAGRSVAVYYARVKTPMWLSISEAHQLLENKDKVYATITGPGEKDKEETCKDALIVAVENGSAGIVPLTLRIRGRELPPGVAALAPLVVTASIENLRSLVGGLSLSASLIGDMIENTVLLKGLVDRGYTVEAARLLDSIVKRNSPRRGDDGRGLEELFKGITKAVRDLEFYRRVRGVTGKTIEDEQRELASLVVEALSSTRVHSGGELGRKVSSSLPGTGPAPKTGCGEEEAYPLASTAILVVRAQRTASRR